MKKPAWQISVDGNKIDTSRLISLSITDNRGLELDTIDLILSDHDHKLTIPRKGVVVNVLIGYQGETLINRGTYFITRVGHSGPPDSLSIGGESGNLNNSELKSSNRKSWRNISISQIINTIAQKYNLTPKVAENLANINIKHLDQADESDAHFLTRLSERYDAVATIKANSLIFSQLGQALSASGKSIKPITINRNEGDTHNYRSADRGRYTGVITRWWNKEEANEEIIEIGTEGYRKQIKSRFTDKDTAEKEAKSEWQRLNRSAATIVLNLANANPSLFTETPLILKGWSKPEIVNNSWIVTKVSLMINENAFSASLTAEIKIT